MSASLELLGIEDLTQSIAEAIAEYPIEAEKSLNRVGLKLKKALVEKSPTSPTMHKKKLAKSWKKRVRGTDLKTLQAEVWNTAPHVGLVDRGHKIKTKSGNTLGYVQGKHFIKPTIEEIGESAVPEEFNKMVKTLAKKIQS